MGIKKWSRPLFDIMKWKLTPPMWKPLHTTTFQPNGHTCVTRGLFHNKRTVLHFCTHETGGLPLLQRFWIHTECDLRQKHLIQWERKTDLNPEFMWHSKRRLASGTERCTLCIFLSFWRSNSGHKLFCFNHMQEIFQQSQQEICTVSEEGCRIFHAWLGGTVWPRFFQRPFSRQIVSLSCGRLAQGWRTVVECSEQNQNLRDNLRGWHQNFQDNSRESSCQPSKLSSKFMRLQHKKQFVVNLFYSTVWFSLFSRHCSEKLSQLSVLHPDVCETFKKNCAVQ